MLASQFRQFAAFALAPVRSIQPQWRSRNEREVEPKLHLVVVTEAATESDAKDLVFLRRILVVVRQVGYPRVRSEPPLLCEQRQALGGERHRRDQRQQRRNELRAR